MSGAIIVLEGADAAGKTTLAEAIVARAIRASKGRGGDVAYLHGRSWVGEVLGHHVRMLVTAARVAEAGGLAVVDHFVVAEGLYGAEYRGEVAYDPAPMLKAIADVGAQFVLCVPTDLQAQHARYALSRDRGEEDFPHARGIIARYANLARGLSAHPGDDFWDRETRFGDFVARSGASVYDMDAAPVGTSKFDDAVTAIAFAAVDRRRGLGRPAPIHDLLELWLEKEYGQ